MGYIGYPWEDWPFVSAATVWDDDDPGRKLVVWMACEVIKSSGLYYFTITQSNQSELQNVKNWVGLLIALAAEAWGHCRQERQEKCGMNARLKSWSIYIYFCFIHSLYRTVLEICNKFGQKLIFCWETFSLIATHPGYKFLNTITWIHS